MLLFEELVVSIIVWCVVRTGSNTTVEEIKVLLSWLYFEMVILYFPETLENSLKKKVCNIYLLLVDRSTW